MTSLQRLLHSKTHIIWDWNGTLLDDVDLSVTIINEILKEHGMKQVNRERYREVFCFPVVDYYRALGFDFNVTPFEIVGKEFFDRYQKRAVKCSLFNDTSDLLEGLKEAKKKHYILSAAFESHLFDIVKHHKIEKYFDGIFGISNVYGTSKIDRGRELLKTIKDPKDSIVFIGDTDHDLEVATALGVEAILLAEGHQSYHRLKKIHKTVLETR